ncbi:MAG TPA: DISARM system phospholipase D-like protein DrmC [Noviherbaspirillum sp.]|uniref:DISARM system phospholipase D-like protein DrmC n=1 Tax=Noviherbaspirillum sp. TaxID=1926288 RepID=UPI002D26F59E|nr:DISARM system phospholipase D-like protein DrmC [Noviherbaspirillum sp.]HYD94745.1 DISARM system phospholipase D-like protein DrmC [Noviherbaspirillum sp.]
MEKLLDAVAAVVCLVSPEKVHAIASRIRRTDTSKVGSTLSGVVGTPAAAGVVDQLVDAWRATTVSAEELASMLLAAGHVFIKAANQQSTELVWTGPTTPFVSARRTEQALLQVINAAEHTLFITSFVAYDVASIVKALNVANDRGVVISMLLELSQDHGGSISFDAIGKMRTQVPASRLYAWRDKAAPFIDGRVHAKVAVADGRMCLITSANLTGHAMDKNMEAGVLISGGHIPQLLSDHLGFLVDTKLVSSV